MNHMVDVLQNPDFNDKMYNDKLLDDLEKSSYNTPFGNRKPNSLYMFIIWVSMKVLNQTSERVKDISNVLKLLNDMKAKMDDIIAFLNSVANGSDTNDDQMNQFAKDWEDICKDKDKIDKLVNGNSYLKKNFGSSLKNIDDMLKTFAGAFSGDQIGWWAPHHGGSVDIHDKNDPNFDHTPTSIKDLLDYITQYTKDHNGDDSGLTKDPKFLELQKDAQMVLHQYANGFNQRDNSNIITTAITTCQGPEGGVDTIIRTNSLLAQGQLTDYNQIMQSAGNIQQTLANSDKTKINNMKSQ